VLGMERASDDAIWAYAKLHGFAIVTHDADFPERSRLYGSPPKVVWLRIGNGSVHRIEAILRHNHSLLLELDQNPELHWVELHP